MTNTFRIGIFNIFVQVAGVFWLLTFIRRAYYYFGQQTWLPIQSKTVIIGTVGIAIAAVAVSWIYRVKITDNEIRGPNFWGGFSTVPLSSQTAIMEKRFLWFKYLKISGATETPIWLLLPVTKQLQMYSLLESRKSNTT